MRVRTPLDGVDLAPGDGICESEAEGLCSLRAAIQATNALPGNQTIQFASGIDDIVLTLDGAEENAAATGDLDITDDVVIRGNGSTAINAQEINDRVFHLPAGTTPTPTVEISNLTISGNTANVDGGGIFNSSGALDTSGSDFSDNSPNNISEPEEE